jgi:hypothetical protein
VHERKPGASTPDEVSANQKKTEKKAAKIAGRQYTKRPKDYGINRSAALHYLFRFLLAFWAAHAGGDAFFFSLFSFEKLCWLPQENVANTYKPSVSHEILHHAE